MTNKLLDIEINSLPKALRDEVFNFVQFLKNKSKKERSISKREFGFAKGKIILSDDFDAPLDEFKEYQ